MKDKNKRSNRLFKTKTKKEKIKKDLKNLGNLELLKDQRKIGVAFSTHNATCSCHMCGNPRKFYNKKTLQELKNDYQISEET